MCSKDVDSVDPDQEQSDLVQQGPKLPVFYETIN